MDKQEILRFADILKREFFYRLKDETAPAGKEFSYVDLLTFLDIAYKEIGIGKEDIEEYSNANRPVTSEIFAYMPAGFKEAYEAAVSKAIDEPSQKKGLAGSAEMKEVNRQFNRIFVTGDIHGDFSDLANRIARIPDASKDDLLIILGDCAFFYYHYYGNVLKDLRFQDFVSKLPITILAIQGNHEVPYKEMPAERVKLFGGEGYESKGILFADNGAELEINGKTFLCIGGAYSVDKDIRLMRGYAWWEHEELSDAELADIEKRVAGKKYDYILTHTCPYSNLPREVFLPGVDQSKVLNRTEKSLDRIKESIKFKKWYCGHFHTDKVDGDVIFLFGGLREII